MEKDNKLENTPNSRVWHFGAEFDCCGFSSSLLVQIVWHVPGGNYNINENDCGSWFKQARMTQTGVARKAQYTLEEGLLWCFDEFWFSVNKIQYKKGVFNRIFCLALAKELRREDPSVLWKILESQDRKADYRNLKVIAFLR